MASNSNTNLLKSIVELRTENSRMEEMVNYLQLENFEYTIEIERLGNMISQIEAAIRDQANKLVDASQNMCDILETCGGDTVNHNGAVRNFVPNVPEKSKTFYKDKVDSPSSVKAHKVKPHTVNGTVLNIPTITLTRVSDLDMQSRSRQSLGENSLEGNRNVSTVTELGPSTSSFNSDQQTMESLEASTSKSPSHSTVLSGTFQEVKIFLNQIGQEREETSPSSNLRSRQETNPSVSMRRRRSRRSSPFPKATRRK